MSNKESFISRLIHILKSPTFVGLFLTLFFSTAAFYYFMRYELISQSNTWLKVIYDIDQKTYDYKLKARGTRLPDPQVAVLAVDDRSINIIGRWPWPRDVMGQSIDNAYKYGAKVIATDIVWSEPSSRPELDFVKRLKSRATISPDIENLFQSEIANSDPDQKFSELIKKNKSKFVIGSFYEYAHIWQDLLNSGVTSSYRSVCHDLILADTDLQYIIDNQRLPTVVIDKYEVLLPDQFQEVYKQHFAEMSDGLNKSITSTSSAFDIYNYKKELFDKKIDYCLNTFLNSNDSDENSDPYVINIRDNWEQLKTLIAGIEFSTFDEWLDAFKNQNLLNAVPESTSWTLSLPSLLNASENFGFFNAALDDDGTIRRSQLLARVGSHYMPSIALQSYLVAKEYNVTVEIDKSLDYGVKGIQSFTVSNSEGEQIHTVPVSASGQILINYAGGRYTVPHASIADLLNENQPNILVTQQVQNEKNQFEIVSKEIAKADFLKDKILVVGATAIGVYDLRVTPFDENYPGVETHANVIDNFLRRDFISKPAKESWALPLMMAGIGVFMSLALAYFGAVSGLVFTIVLLGAIGAIDFKYFFLKGQLISVFLPMLQILFTYVFLTFYKYFTEERSKKELRATFSKYVSPAIVEEILKDPKNLELGGKKERITVFFSDVRGFTTISEKLDPRALCDLLNSYLTPMTELVFKNQGTLDKYMGDAIMAFFGAPVSYPDHAKMACKCALESLEKLKELQKIYESKKLPQIDIGIGLNTGECSVGNMGSHSVQSYTVMGDAVNLASRLEGINKTYGTRIIISEFTQMEVKDDFLCREVDWVRVKGKLKPVKIFELMSENQKQSELAEMAKYFGDGYALYHSRKFNEAVKLFEKALTHSPSDLTSKLYIERCQEFITSPPPENWDGVYVMKTK